MQSLNRSLASGFAVLVMLTLFLGHSVAKAGLFDNTPFGDSGPVDVEKAFVFGSVQEGASLQLFWDIPDDYYLYRDRIELKIGEQTQIIERTNSPAELKEDPLFGQVWVYHNRAEVDFTLASRSDMPVDDRVSVTYQGCWEGGICYPPVTKELSLQQVPAATQAVESAQSSNGSEFSPASALNSAPEQVLSEQDEFAQMLKEGSMLVTMGAFFVAGLALSFTPCVFPMIPILSSLIAGQGRHVTAARGFFLSLIYVLAVSVTYTLAGIFAGLFGENLQALFQNVWVIVTFSIVFVLLSLSMFGLYELQLSSGLQTRLSSASNSQKGGTVTGVAIMGFLSALIVGPCMAAPLAGALIYIGQTGDPVLGGIALFSMSLGMGVPLLLIGTSAGKLLPHAGLWMDKVKAVFGILLLLLAVWMLDRVVPVEVTMWLTAIILIVSSVYMGVLAPPPRKNVTGKSQLARGFGLVVLLYAAALFVGALSGSKSFIYPLQGLSSANAQVRQELSFIKVTTPEQLQQQLKTARSMQQPVMLDFYADWCVSCVELDLFTFSDSGVQNALQPFMRIKVDVTANDEAAKALNKTYSLIGPPALIFYNAKGELQPHKTLIGVVDPQDFVNHISEI